MTTTDKSSSAIDAKIKEIREALHAAQSNQLDGEVGRLSRKLVTLYELRPLIDEELKSAYSKGASDMLEKVKADIKGVYENYHYPMPEALILELIDNALLSQQQGAVAHEKHDCQFSGCDKTNAERFYSYEESYVWLCPEHTELNIKKKTGYPEPQGAVEK